MIETIGYIAGVLTTLAFVPQVLRTFRTRSTEDLSFSTLVLLISGVALWLVYGLMLRATPVILANAVTLVLVGALVFMKHAFRGR